MRVIYRVLQELNPLCPVSAKIHVDSSFSQDTFLSPPHAPLHDLLSRPIQNLVSLRTACLSYKVGHGCMLTKTCYLVQAAIGRSAVREHTRNWSLFSRRFGLGSLRLSLQGFCSRGYVNRSQRSRLATILHATLMETPATKIERQSQGRRAQNR
jgi:hypothetical protein